MVAVGSISKGEDNEGRKAGKVDYGGETIIIVNDREDLDCLRKFTILLF